jgi:hypothetical protein
MISFYSFPPCSLRRVHALLGQEESLVVNELHEMYNEEAY